MSRARIIQLPLDVYASFFVGEDIFVHTLETVAAEQT
jgi:hypothetical protein